MENLQKPKVDKIYCAPGNAGIAELAECVDFGVMDFGRQVAFAREKEIDLTIIGPDDPWWPEQWMHLKQQG